MALELSKDDVLADPRRVETVRLVVQHDATINYNHWSIHLNTRYNNSIVRLKMLGPREGAPDGALVFHALDYDLGDRVVGNWDFQTAEGLRIQHVVSMIYATHKDRFTWTGIVGDCRFWT